MDPSSFSCLGQVWTFLYKKLGPISLSPVLCTCQGPRTCTGPGAGAVPCTCTCPGPGSVQCESCSHDVPGINCGDLIEYLVEN